ncbi:sugar ABC transporter permease [Ornithinimicrobium avium]|uniref:Sugar ABC transporter permease n=2 Tax=Ornithinimicrobium avium TaxID=2283195 RepID=A0A345NSV0_9MICO|nr:sugar ABC transporter permease [Ornithinimicrobium avium]
MLVTLVVYPIGYSIWRSLFDARGDTFVGLANYARMFTDPATFTALKNNVIWVLVTPALVTVLGLIFAVLTERVRWGTAFKLIVFMPMAISFLAAGIIFRVVYERDPQVGLANAVVTGVYEVFTQQASYPGAGPRPGDLLVEDGAGGYATAADVDPGSTVPLPLVGVGAEYVPADPVTPQPPEQAAADAITGTVWFDFTRGGGGTPGEIDPSEVALPGVQVQALSDGEVVGQDRTDEEGRYVIEGVDGPVTVALPADNFTTPFRGVAWLGPTLVTPAIILAYVWMWAGFAMVLIGAGLAAISRDALEAARIDGASEWQVFRHITVPLLSPVLTVVFVTMIINVLKIFDLVYILAPGSSAQAANVIAVEMWSVSFGGGQNFGMGSALGVFLFLLVLPAMLFNIRRFKQEQQ